MKQFNIFGDEVEVVEELIPQPRKKQRQCKRCTAKLRTKHARPVNIVDAGDITGNIINAFYGWIFLGEGVRQAIYD